MREIHVEAHEVHTLTSGCWNEKRLVKVEAEDAGEHSEMARDMLGLAEEGRLSFEKTDLRTLTDPASDMEDGAMERVNDAKERGWLYYLGKNTKKEHTKERRKRKKRRRRKEGEKRNHPSSLRDHTNGGSGPHQGGGKTYSREKVETLSLSLKRESS
jgi:hypothetical protein